ncbi:MinD/ParA family ATP-binding protein [Arthrobacter sp.]|uniref:MinD/ParA family ATP-binding protein n=1 Tax=Arthrobacter sp. TaxID=1667 RepID=UPI003A903F48
MNDGTKFPGAARSGMYEEQETPDAVQAQSGGAPDSATPAPDPVPDEKALSAAAPEESPVKPAGGSSGALSLLPDDDELEVMDPATTGSRGFWNKVTGGLLKLSPSRVELDARALVNSQEAFEASIRQASWTRAAGIAVANKKGNTGKTPVTLCLSAILASIRGGSVAAVEFTDDKGQLAYRAEGDPALGIGELAKDLQNVRTQSQLRGYTVTQTSFASVIGSTSRHRPPLTEQDVTGVSNLVDDYFTMRVMDTANQYSSSAFTGVLAVTDVLVVPTMNSMDSVFDALELLEFLEKQGGKSARLARTAIIIRLSDGRPEFKASRISNYFLEKGIPAERIFSIPYEEHIAERGEISLKKLAEPTRHAFTAVAAAVVAQANQTITEEALKEHQS